ncbi:MAG: galactokinase [Nocardioides sp.]
MPTRPDVVEPGEPEQIAAALAAAFEDRSGRAPDGVYAAPGRVNLIGEHLDYNGGRVLPIALPHACYVAAGPRDDALVSVHSLQSEDTWSGSLDDVADRGTTGFAAYAAGALWALREDGVDVPGLDLVVDGRVPLGAGLSSSAALEVSVALAACGTAGHEIDDLLRERLVTACIRAENDVVGAPTGGMDQAVAAFAAADHALLIDFASGVRSLVPWQPATADLTLLVVDTRVQHSLSDGSYGDRRGESQRAAAALGVDTLVGVDDVALAGLDDDVLRRRARHVAAEDARVGATVAALGAGDFNEVGRLFTASHVSMRDDYEISCRELDTVVETSLAAGAIGARMTGGGFGGSAIVLLPSDRLEIVETAVARAFEDRQWRVPGVLRAPASAAAYRVR